MAIEVEIRSFISEEKYLELLKYFSENAVLVKEEEDETEYYAEQGGVRLWRNQDSAKIILKSGNIHDEQREENEIYFDKSDFQTMQRMFKKLGIEKQIKWKRKRHTFNWEGINVQIGDNRGYGFVIELEKLSEGEEREKVVELLKEKLKILKIDLTPREKFDEKYEHYKNNWQSLLNEQANN